MLKAFLKAFSLVFLAEMGDKTQLAVFAMAASTGAHKGMVYVGAILAFLLTTAIAVAAGDVVMRVVPALYIRLAAGSLFILFGILLFIGKF